MIVEHALLHVIAGEVDAFKAAMAQAKPLIFASPGFQSIEVRREIEETGCYLLIVHWDDVSSHRDGFRKSDRYEAWGRLLHRFYNPMPIVRYFGEPL